MPSTQRFEGCRSCLGVLFNMHRLPSLLRHAVMGVCWSSYDSRSCCKIERNCPKSVCEHAAPHQRSCTSLQVRGFWAQLEAATNERQQAMFRMLNVHLERLAKRVETVVGDLLEVCASSPMPPLPQFSATGPRDRNIDDRRQSVVLVLVA